MRVLVNLSNILEYGLDTLTGNSRDDLLARAKEMEAAGYELFITIPDVEGGDKEAPTERNVFDHFNAELPEPDGVVHAQAATNLNTVCSYAFRDINGEHKWICVIHDSPSKHIIEPGFNMPCLVMDPYGHDWEL